MPFVVALNKISIGRKKSVLQDILT